MTSATPRGAAGERKAALPPSPPEGQCDPGLGLCCCPFCDHAVEHAPEDRETARLAIVSHVVRVHGMTATRLLLEFPELERAALSYSQARR